MKLKKALFTSVAAVAILAPVATTGFAQSAQVQAAKASNRNAFDTLNWSASKKAQFTKELKAKLGSDNLSNALKYSIYVNGLFVNNVKGVWESGKFINQFIDGSDAKSKAMANTYIALMHKFGATLITGEAPVETKPNGISQADWDKRNKPGTTTAATALSATGRINYKPGYGVVLRSQNGQVPAKKQYVKHGSSWKVNAQKVINGATYYRLGNDNQWVEAKFVKLSTSKATTKPAAKPVAKATSKVIQINYIKNYGVVLRDANGKVPAKKQYVKHGSKWKVVGTKTINGETYINLGNKNQWIQAKYI